MVELIYNPSKAREMNSEELRKTVEGLHSTNTQTVNGYWNPEISRSGNKLEVHFDKGYGSQVLAHVQRLVDSQLINSQLTT